MNKLLFAAGLLVLFISQSVAQALKEDENAELKVSVKSIVRRRRGGESFGDWRGFGSFGRNFGFGRRAFGGGFGFGRGRAFGGFLG